MKLGHITICCSKKDNLHFIVVYTSSHDIKNATITKFKIRNRYISKL